MASYDQVAWALVTGAPSPATTGTSLSVTTGHGARFPASTVTYEALVYSLTDPGANERVRVTSRSTDVISPIVRNVDGRGAQAIAAVGWAIHAIHTHGLLAMEGPTGVFVAQSNSTGPFAVYTPTANPAKSLQIGDALHHKQSYLFINSLGGAHTFTLNLGFGLNGVAQQVFHTVAISVPANTTYNLDVDVMLYAYTTANQYIKSKVTVVNATTGAHVDTKLVIIASGTFDTAANDYHFLHTGAMDAASASLTIQGYPSWTTLVRGS